MEYPQNNIWGPHLWTILHSVAERIGSKSLKHLPGEEKRIWAGLLASLRYSLPCPQCKKHYLEYYSSNPIQSINEIRLWLYNLHSQINSRNEKTNITIDQISEIYSKPFHFTYHYAFIIEQMKRALRHKWSSRNDIQCTFRFLIELKCFYDLF